MTVSSSIRSEFREPLHRTNESWIKIKYWAEEYQETINQKAITMGTLWSHIGGIIGLFFGYSILNIADVVFAVIVALKDKILKE